MKQLKIENVDRSDDEIMAHFSVWQYDEFLGDFSITYERSDLGGYVNRDFEGYRAIGGVFAYGDKPTIGVLELAADKLTDEYPTVEARQFHGE